MRKIEVRLSAKVNHNLRLVPPKIALSIIEHATIEDDDDLHSLWANLLATGLDGNSDSIHTKYISVLSDLTADDALVLKTLCEQWLDPNNPPKLYPVGSITYGPTVDGTAKHDTVSIITLNRLGFISPGYTNIITYSANDNWRSYKGPEFFNTNEFRSYGDLEVVEITDFSLAFYKAVIAG